MRQGLRVASRRLRGFDKGQFLKVHRQCEIHNRHDVSTTGETIMSTAVVVTRILGLGLRLTWAPRCSTLAVDCAKVH